MKSTDANHAQLKSASYKLAVEDLDFLLSEEMRAMRFALEYQKAESYLHRWGVRSTVVVFGSARIPSPEAAEAARAKARVKSEIAKAENALRRSRWYAEARQFGRIVSERGGALAADQRLRDNVVATGGGPGIMEAANRGASDVGAPSIGFNITLPHEQFPNPHSTPELTFRFHYFAMRKMHLAMRANALAVFPGGFGTLDELFEILTLQQTGKAPPMPVVLFGREYWTGILNFEAMLEENVISERDLDLFEMVDTAEEAWQAFMRRGLVAHTPAAPGA
ncbi:MAG: LOG family protein [Hyphomicrobiaceae bacterium]